MAAVSTGDKPVDRRIARTTERVRAAAVEIATTQGVAACTMQAIAEHAGVARSTIYRHWDDPVELLVEALEVLSTPPLPNDTEAVTSLSETISSITSGLAHALTSTPWGNLVAELVAASPHQPNLEEILRRFVRARLDISAQFILAAQQRGELSAHLDPDYVLGLIVGPIYYRHLITRQPLDNEWTTAHSHNIHALIKSSPTQTTT